MIELYHAHISTCIGLESIRADLSEFKRWYDRMRARPSFEKAFYPGSRVALPGNESALA